MQTTWGKYVESNIFYDTSELRRILHRAFGEELTLKSVIDKTTFNDQGHIIQQFTLAITNAHLLFCKVDRTIDESGLRYSISTKTQRLSDVVSLETSDEYSEPRPNADIHKAVFRLVFSTASGMEPLTLSPADYQVDYNKRWRQEFESFLSALREAIGLAP